MQWEYACLVRTMTVNATTNTWESNFTFHGPSATVVSLEGDSSIEILNRLGRDGWEALSVESRHELYGSSFSTNYIETLVERDFWLKRPINTGTTR